MSRSDRNAGPPDGREARRTRSTGTDAKTGELPVAAAPAAGDDSGGSPVVTTPRHKAVRLALLAMLVALAALALFVAWGLAPMSETSRPVEFEVLPGWGASLVSRELEREGLVRNARLFSAYLRVRGLDRSIGEGIYDLDSAASAPELAETLVRGGRPRVVDVLLPEGARAEELMRRLASNGLGEVDRYRELVEQPGDLRRAYMPEGASLEGYLFPARYEIPVMEEPPRTLDRLLERFERELDEEVRSQLGELGLSVHEWVILASLVQAEAGSDQEMQLIAGVFLNRLDLGMLLQSDPTVAYGLGKPLPELDAVAGDLRKDHPWNTYTRPGLPRGPISNPGRAALRSILEPKRLDEQGRPYLYFLHGTDEGEPVFRPNVELEGHNRDVARYLRGQ